MQSIDPVLLQRLVDGELGLDDTQQLLRAASTNPDLWREMASSFVENRMWQNNFNESNGAFDSNAGTMQGPSRKNQRRPVAATDSPTYVRHSSQWWLSIAAGTLLVLSIGFAAGQWRSNLDPIGQGFISQNTGNVGAAAEKPALNQIVYRPDYRMQLEDPQGNQLVESAIPLYDVRRAQELGLTLKPRDVPDDVLQFINNSGYQMKQNVHYMSGRMSDGRPFVVPIRRFEFFPGQ